VTLSALDNHDEHPTLTHSGNTITMTDATGNTTTINLTRYQESSTKLKLTYNSITRNGITTTIPSTTIEYNWLLQGTQLKDLDTKVKIHGEEKYTMQYNKGKDETKIKTKVNNQTTTTTRAGHVIVTVVTEQGGVEVSY
jgi:hypothetical protein